MNNTEKALAAALSQTGFPFEHYIVQQTSSRGWTTIPNRLYIDAEEEKTREMDLLCYRVDKSQEVTTYTSLLISCKARSDKPWVLMTRPWPKQTPVWYSYPPVPIWTNSKALGYEVSLANWGAEYFDKAETFGLQTWASDSREEVFALQEFEQSKSDRFVARGDSSLYSGVMSLLKALAYELNALKERRAKEKDLLVYQFNLIQMLDGDLYEASFASGSPVVKQVKRYRYYARTMLNGKDLSARIDFCTKEGLGELLEDLAGVHMHNARHFNEKHKYFFDNAIVSQARLDALKNQLESKLDIAYILFAGKHPKPSPGWVHLKYEAFDECLVIKVNCHAPADELNVNTEFKRFASRFVKDIYRYTGDIRIEEDDIPF